MKVLVTGATGFIGREIVCELLKKNIEVIQVAGPKSQTNNPKEKRLSNFYAIDISVYGNLSELENLEKIDAVIHSAGLAHQFGNIEKAKFDAVNVVGTQNIARLAATLKAQQFLLISSTAIYGLKKSYDSKNGRSVIVINENTECQPKTLYAESKLNAERAAIKICEEKKIALTILRLAPVIGEGNVGNTARLLEAIDKGRFVWVGSGVNLKTLIYKTDVARACVEILIKKKGQTEVFNLAAEPISMREFVGEIAKRLNKKIPKFSIPLSLLRIILQLNAKLFGSKRVYKISDMVEKWLSDDVYSAKKIKEMYGFQPKFSIHEAIERQVKFYKTKKQQKLQQK
ncbi:MAG: NAD(P)-dependent oxidoreductase [Acidobacteriota bacterium]|nr:NAD(P)-dependent oxidoreductase [Acidobacteriota bacterium]